MEFGFDLTGKKILVTGATSGIGKAIAEACADYGAHVYCIGRKIENISGLSEKYIDRVTLIRADLTAKEGIDSVLSSIPDALNGVVHCAGIGQRVLCKFMGEADIDRVMDINFKAPVMLMNALIQSKKIAAKSSVVFIASKAAEWPSIGNSIYSASKGAIISYAKCLSLELAPRSIRVNCISPAMVWTDLIMADGLSKEQLEEDQRKYPLKRYGMPDDIAGLAIYLLSDVSSWMTGSNISITGGVNSL